MPRSVYELCTRLKVVEREHLIIRGSAIWFENKVGVDSSLLEKATGVRPPNVTPVHLHSAIEQLEPTYIIRLFAEFEAGLRFYWENVAGRSTVPKMQDLIESITSRWRIDDSVKNEVHAVRTYRNYLIHAGNFVPSPISIAEARSRLCEFVARGESHWS